LFPASRTGLGGDWLGALQFVAVEGDALMFLPAKTICQRTQAG